jgi:hypothetical protein
VQMITGGACLSQHAIDHVDMLKIDVEGAECMVPRGLANAFARGMIDLVQFEYGPINLTTREFPGDCRKLFTARGYTAGKLFPADVAFKTCQLDDEDLVGPNYVARRTGRTDLIAARRCPPLKLPSP